MKALFVLMFAVSLAMQASAVTARQGGVFAKFGQLPVVQRVAEVWQGTGHNLARKTLVLGMLIAAACAMPGCGNDEGEGGVEVNSLRERMIADQGHFYSDKHIYFWTDASGNVERGYVLGYRYNGAGGSTFLIQSLDGTEQIIDDEQISGHMFNDHPDVGKAVDLRGDKVDESMTGIITAVYGYFDSVEKWEGGRHKGELITLEGESGDYVCRKIKHRRRNVHSSWQCLE